MQLLCSIGRIAIDNKNELDSPRSQLVEEESFSGRIPEKPDPWKDQAGNIF